LKLCCEMQYIEYKKRQVRDYTGTGYIG